VVAALVYVVMLEAVVEEIPRLARMVSMVRTQIIRTNVDTAAVPVPIYRTTSSRSVVGGEVAV